MRQAHLVSLLYETIVPYSSVVIVVGLNNGGFDTRMTSKQKQQFYRHVRALSSLLQQGKYGIESAAETILVLWSGTQCPSLTCDGLTFSEEFATLAKVQRFVAWMGQLELLDSAYWLSSAYAIWAGDEYRKNLAMFFTPPSITKRLLDDLEQAGVSFTEHSFFDPACGGAAFLAPIAQRMRSALLARGATPSEILEQVGQRLFGVDLDSVLCRMSRHFLRMVLHAEISEAHFEPEFYIAQADSLSQIDSLAGTIDVVVCNPPYRKMLSAEVALYRGRFANVIEAQTNLYSLFITLCLRLLKAQGLAALVTPTSFLSGQSFSKLRSYLMENSEILHIGIVADRSGVFINVEQETALTLLRQRQPEHAAETTAHVSVVSKEGNLTSVGVCVLPNSGSAWPIPRNEGDAEVLHLAGVSPYRLADYGYRVRIGAWVWNRDERRTFRSVTDARRAKSPTVFPLLWSSDIRQGGWVHFSGKAKPNGEHSFVDVSGRSIASVVKHPAVLLQRVTSNEQPRRLVAAVVPATLLESHGGFVGENHTVILEAIKDCGFPPDLLVALMSSSPIDRYFRCISGSINVSVFELSQLPLPAPDQLRAALEQGLSMEAAVIVAFGQRV